MGLNRVLKYIFFIFLSIVIIAFSGCSTKKVFEPKVVKDDWQHYGTTENVVIDKTSDVALLQNRSVLTRDSLLDVKIDKTHRLIGKSDGWIVSADIDGNLTLQSISDRTLSKHFKLKKTIASASVNGDVLAVLFANNDMALYNVSDKKLFLMAQGEAPTAIDARVTAPYFMNDLVLFLTLDGKIVIINYKLKKKLRTIIISSEENFNNVIYFNLIDSKLIAATAYKILSLGEKEIRVNYEIRNVVYDDKNIFITTKQGEVVSLTPNLQVNAKVKFPFAHFLGMIAYEDKLYLLEKEGYIIELSKDLLKYDVYNVDLEDGYVFVADEKFFIHDEYISVVK